MKRLAVLGLIVAAVVVSQSTDPRIAAIMLLIFGFGFYLSYVRARGS